MTVNNLKLYCLVIIGLLSACSQNPRVSTEIKASKLLAKKIPSIPDAVPRFEERTRAGNPDSYTVFGKRYYVQPESKGYSERGIASWYGPKFHNKKTSNGEVYDMYGMTAAHKTLPIPSYVKVTNLTNQRTVILRVNDRGPFHDGRIIDLSYTAAVKLGIDAAGTGLVKVTTIEPEMTKENQLKYNTKKPIFLQVGVFSDRINAVKIKEKISIHKGFPETRIRSLNDGKSIVHKVQLGPLDSVFEVHRMADKLAQLGLKSMPYVIDEAH